MKKKIKTMAIIILIVGILSEFAISRYYTNKTYEIITSAVFSKGKNYKLYSDNISKEDYKVLSGTCKDFYDLYINDEKINKDIVFNYPITSTYLFFPHNFFVPRKLKMYVKGQKVDKTYHPYDIEHYIETLYTFEIDIKGFDINLKIIDELGAGMS